MSKEKEYKKSGLLLKKIAAGKGRITGEFYFVSNSSGDDSMIVIRIAEDENKVGKVIQLGRKYRSAISGAKFASGLILATPKKVIFETHTGTAPARVMKTAFREYLSKQTDLGLLRKVTLKTAGQDVAKEDEGQELTDQDVEGISDDEIQEIVQKQEKIANLNTVISKKIKADAVKEFQQGIKQQQRMIARLEEEVLQNPSDEGYDKLQEARVEFAESMTTGPDPFSSDTLSPEIQTTLKVAAHAAIASLQDSYNEMVQQLVSMADHITSTSDEEERQRRRAEVLPKYNALRSASRKSEEAIASLFRQIPV